MDYEKICDECCEALKKIVNEHRKQELDEYTSKILVKEINEEHDDACTDIDLTMEHLKNMLFLLL